MPVNDRQLGEVVKARSVWLANHLLPSADEHAAKVLNWRASIARDGGCAGRRRPQSEIVWMRPACICRRGPQRRGARAPHQVLEPEWWSRVGSVPGDARVKHEEVTVQKVLLPISERRECSQSSEKEGAGGSVRNMRGAVRDDARRPRTGHARWMIDSHLASGGHFRTQTRASL